MRFFNIHVLFAMLLLVLVSGGCASRQASDAPAGDSPAMGGEDEADWLYDDEEEAAAEVPDPFEGYNRLMFGFNDVLITGVIKPVSRGYDFLMPDPAEQSISNFFDNARFPIRWVASTAQGKHGRAKKEARKFLVNTTTGVLGIWKPSDNYEELRDVPGEDLGQTLGDWGVGSGPYLVVPLLGGTNLRDALGFVGGSFLYPFTYLPEWEYTMAARVAEGVNESPGAVETYEEITEATVDPYTAIKEGYHERREAAIDE